MIPPRLAHLLVVAALLATVSWLDWITGYEVSVLVFYFAPIAYAAWHLGRVWSFLVAFCCAVLISWVEVSTGRHYSHSWMAWEYGGMRVLTLGFIAFSFCFFKATADKNRLRIRQLEGMLHVCTSCHRVKDPDGNWLELSSMSSSKNSSSLQARLCPICARETYARGQKKEA